MSLSLPTLRCPKGRALLSGAGTREQRHTHRHTGPGAHTRVPSGTHTQMHRWRHTGALRYTGTCTGRHMNRYTHTDALSYTHRHTHRCVHTQKHSGIHRHRCTHIGAHTHTGLKPPGVGRDQSGSQACSLRVGECLRCLKGTGPHQRRHLQSPPAMGAYHRWESGKCGGSSWLGH